MTNNPTKYESLLSNSVSIDELWRTVTQTKGWKETITIYLQLDKNNNQNFIQQIFPFSLYFLHHYAIYEQWWACQNFYHSSSSFIERWWISVVFFTEYNHIDQIWLYVSLCRSPWSMCILFNIVNLVKMAL